MEFRRILLHEVQELTSYIEELETENVDRFISQLERIRGKLIIIGVGKSGLVGRKIAATLASTGTPSFFVHPSEAYHGDLGMISSDDGVLLLSNSGESAEVLQLLPYLKQKVAHIFSISKNPNSSLAKGSDFHLVVGVKAEGCPLNLAPMSSTTLLMAIGDAIAGELIVRKKLSENDFAVNHPGGLIGQRLFLSMSSITKPWIIESSNPKFSDIIDFMIEQRASAVLVKSTKSYRLITDGDIRRAIKVNNLVDIEICGTISPITINAESALIGLKDRMTEAGISHIVVLKGKDPIGIINKSDLL